jgi:hypothetical protein
MIVLGLLVMALVSGPRPGLAADERWCAIYASADGNGGVNCGFYTLQQCRDTIQGTDRCEFDYFYQSLQEQKKPRASPKRHTRERP